MAIFAIKDTALVTQMKKRRRPALQGRRERTGMAIFAIKDTENSWLGTTEQMEQHQRVNVTSPWSVQGPYDVNSILHYLHQDESSHESRPPTHNIKLVPPPSTNDDNTVACELLLTCRPCTSVRSVEVTSNARHVELYDDLDAYSCTVKGDRLDSGEGESEREAVMYSARLVGNSPLPNCRLKFVSLTEKHQLTLSRLTVTTVRSERGSYSGVAGSNIDMAKVRSIMAMLPQPVPPNVQNLMETIEQYQKNQASVLEDFQQAAAMRLSSSNNPKVSLTSNMAGLLSAFSKASLLQQTARTHTASRGCIEPNRTVGTNEVTTASKSALSSDKCDGDARVGDGSSTDPQLNMDALSKLMTSFGMGQPAGDQDRETDGSAQPQEMFSALRTMCRDVNHMRAAERQAAERSYGPERRLRQDHANTSGNTSESEKSTYSNRMVEVEHRLMGYVTDMEKRIMTRLDRQLELLQDHIDLRFNKLEVLLSRKSSEKTMNAD